jgi:glycosyltransferase involved in cell wall biosynthesis
MTEKRMRIVHLVSSWEHVGAVRRINLLAQHLDPAGYECHLVALSARGPDPDSIMAGRVPATALAAGERLALPLAWRLRCLTRQLRADIVHVWDRQASRVARMAFVGRSRHSRIVSASVNDLPPGIDIDPLEREASGGLSREKLLAEISMPPNALLLGTAGHLINPKEIIDLLWAMDQIRCVRDDVFLLVVGDGHARALAERYMRLYQVDDYVRFLGWRSDSTAILRWLDIYCAASLRASVSLAMLEAMALGVPVVAADTPANRTAISAGESGFLIDVGQRSEMARWCLRILEDTPLAAEMRKKAHQQAVERFPITRFVDACKKLYRGP